MNTHSGMVTCVVDSRTRTALHSLSIHARLISFLSFEHTRYIEEETQGIRDFNQFSTTCIDVSCMHDGCSVASKAI